jgi:sortase A
MRTTNTEDPVIVRRGDTSTGAAVPSVNKPGVHSRNSHRSREAGERRSGPLRIVRLALLMVGVAGTGYYAYTVADQYVYQTYQNWAFDQQIAGQAAVGFSDFVRAKAAPFGFLPGAEGIDVDKADKNAPPAPQPRNSVAPPPVARPTEGSLLGRVEINRLNLSAIVREGVDDETLSKAVGHVPATALPGQLGNFAIAAHRDTLFRVLKDIRKDDLVSFQSPAGTYTYRVQATKIVKPSDVSVLRADGGGLIAGQIPEKLLTMITCYPFYYVGSAPKRFIVEAALVSNAARATESTTIQVPVVAAAGQASAPRARSVRGSSRTRGAASSSFSHWDTSGKPKKKRGFWHRMFHVS